MADFQPTQPHPQTDDSDARARGWYPVSERCCAVCGCQIDHAVWVGFVQTCGDESCIVSAEETEGVAR